jgi:hypothetical protein
MDYPRIKKSLDQKETGLYPILCRIRFFLIISSQTIYPTTSDRKSRWNIREPPYE